MDIEKYKDILYKSVDADIKFICEDGSQTYARTPSMGLFQWYNNQLPKNIPENMEPFEVYQVGPPIPGPDCKEFLSLVIAAIERRWGRGPNVGMLEVPKPDQDRGYFCGSRYEFQCMRILHWLNKNGDIVYMMINETMEGDTD